MVGVVAGAVGVNPLTLLLGEGVTTGSGLGEPAGVEGLTVVGGGVGTGAGLLDVAAGGGAVLAGIDTGLGLVLTTATCWELIRACGAG